uniref:MarR family transcriptional regulator n=1 Tax=Fervidobacterium nodosum TaxID=2424 RepID=A0A7C5Y3S9_9BACT
MKDFLNQHNILYQMSVLQRKIFKVINEKVSKEYMLHPGQIPMLFLIQKHPGISQREIAKIMDVEPGTVAVMLKRMEKSGLVYRQEDSKDRRISRVFLTSKAQEILNSVRVIVRDIETSLMEALTQEEQKQLDELLSKIRNKIDEQFVANEQRKESGDGC